MDATFKASIISAEYVVEKIVIDAKVSAGDATKEAAITALSRSPLRHSRYPRATLT